VKAISDATVLRGKLISSFGGGSTGPDGGQGKRSTVACEADGTTGQPALEATGAAGDGRALGAIDSADIRTEAAIAAINGDALAMA
jgi:hypothetical protein